MSAADQAIFEACAAQEYQLSLAEARAHALIAAQIETSGKMAGRLAWPSSVAEALDQARQRSWSASRRPIQPRAASTTATRRSAGLAGEPATT